MAPHCVSPEASISSHTLSAGSAMDPLQPSSAFLLKSPENFLQPSIQLREAFLTAAKTFLDPLATQISEVQQLRRQELRKKRKRGDYDGDIEALHLRRVHVDGFGVNQVFEQARKVVDATIGEVELSFPASRQELVSEPNGVGSEVDEEDIEESVDESSVVEDDAEFTDDEEEVLEDDILLDEEEEAMSDEDMDADDADGILSDASDDEPAETYRPDPNGLNDGFFSIDDFNKATEFLEQQDARGEPVASDDEEIDWDGDPFAAGVGNGREVDGDFSEDDFEEDGPTFGDADLNAPEGESEDDDLLDDGDIDGLGTISNANNIMYSDFFAPPASKAGKKNKKKRGRPNPHNFPVSNIQENEPQLDEDAENIERTMSAVHRDLFEDDDSAGSESELSELDPSDPRSRRSNHERRQAKLAEEIRRLESANVAKRDWQLSGEASASARPLNSLLEEDLEFERQGKPTPVITAEVSEEIEALIKRRILASEFDEVLRRRPDDLATGPARRGRFELDDTKSGKGLAEIYEEEHLRLNDPNFVDAKDEKLGKEHAEIESLWKSVSAKLDSLSSWHYKPKPAVPNLEIRVDAPAIEMEDARPTAGGEVAGASMLAPQELYKPGEDKAKTEIVTKAGMPIAREELTREQKLRRRRREKERIKNANLNKPAKASAQDKKADEKKRMLGDLKKGGVQIIGKKGQLTDVEGKQVREKPRSGGGSFKL